MQREPPDTASILASAELTVYTAEAYRAACGELLASAIASDAGGTRIRGAYDRFRRADRVCRQLARRLRRARERAAAAKPTHPSGVGAGVVHASPPSVALLDGKETLAALVDRIAHARGRVWMMQFVIDARPREDRHGEVRALLDTLGAAAARGVDVRAVLPVLPSLRGVPYDRNAPAARYLCARGVAVRRYRDAKRPLLHSKLIVIDDWCLASNLNWTPAAFGLNVEMGLALESAGIGSAAFAFERVWAQRTVRCCGSQSTASVPRSAPLAAIAPPSVQTSGSSRHMRSSPTLVAGLAYVRAVERAIKDAGWCVWIAMYGLRASTAPRLRPLLDAIATCRDRRVDVRVLYDPRAERADMAADLPALSDAGVSVRPWPMRGRFHVRAVSIDQAELFIGSVAWTPQSIFLAEDVAAHTRNDGAGKHFATTFDGWWELASADPATWPLRALELAPEHADALRRGGLTTLDDVRGAPWVRGVHPDELKSIATSAHWMIAHRMPAPVAAMLGRAGVESHAALEALVTRSELHAKLTATSGVDGTRRLVAPTVSFLARAVTAVRVGTARMEKSSVARAALVAPTR